MTEQGERVGGMLINDEICAKILPHEKEAVKAPKMVGLFDCDDGWGGLINRKKKRALWVLSFYNY